MYATPTPPDNLILGIVKSKSPLKYTLCLEKSAPRATFAFTPTSPEDLITTGTTTTIVCHSLDAFADISIAIFPPTD